MNLFFPFRDVIFAKRDVAMKRILILVCLSLITLHLAAQSEGIGPRHEMRFGVGVLPEASSNLTAYDIDRDCGVGAEYDRTHLSVGNLYKTPSLNFSYTGRLTRWWELGFVVSYHTAYTQTFNNDSNKKVGYYADHYVHLMPTVRFVWFERNLVRMYSSLGVGLGALVGCAKPNRSASAKRECFVVANYEVVGLGISVGRRVFGFAEFGVATRGFINVGVGYRLFTQKQKRDGEIY